MMVNVVLVSVFDTIYENPKIISLFRAWAILYPVCVQRSMMSVSTANVYPQRQLDQYLAFHTRVTGGH